MINYRKHPGEIKTVQPCFKPLSNIELVDITYNKLFINKQPLNFSGSTEKQLIANLINKPELINAPDEIKKGLPLLLDTICKAINEFEKTNKIDFNEGIKAANKLDESLKNDAIKAFEAFLLKTDPECLDRSKNLPSDDSIEGVMMQVQFSKNYKTKTPPEELSKAFNTFYCRKLLNDHTVGLLNHYKNLDALKPFKKEMDTFTKLIDKKILNLGLSPAVKDIVKKAEANLGTRLEIYDSPVLARLIYDRLEYFKSIDRSVADILNVIDFDESYGSGVYSKWCKQNLAESSIKYCTENDLIDKQAIRLNPWDLLKMMNTGEEQKVSSLLTHEHGHLWHNEKIGDELYYNPDKQLAFVNLLEPEEKELFTKYKNLVVEAIPGLEGTFANPGKVVSNFNEIKSELRFKLKFDDKLTDAMVEELTPIIRKFEAVIRLIDELPDAYAKTYAKTSPGELVACAVEWSDRASYSEEFKELLSRFDAPQLLSSN